MRFDLPSPQPDTQPFWDGAARGQLMIMRCRSTGRFYGYPRPFDPATWHDDVEWVEASGEATLYTYSVVHRNDLPPWPDRVPYTVAMVDLAEGPRMQTNIVGCRPDELEIGMALEVEFAPLDEALAIPVFRPARERAAPQGGPSTR